MKRISWLVLCLISLSGRGAGLPELVLPSGVGVNIHFVTGHERDLDLIRDAGFKFIRMDFGWESIERQKGQYDWKEYDELLAHLEARGMRPVFILDYSNPLYEETVTSVNPVTHHEHKTLASPQHPESVAAYARWAAAAAKHYQGRQVIWELWNEPNITFWNPKPDVNQYVTLALAACRAIRESLPHATIVGPASSTFPWPFLEAVLKSGLLEYLDGVSVHPYRDPHRAPETAAADYQRLREMIDRYAPPARKGKIPILSGEWGYSSWKKGVSPETQGTFAARQQLSNLLNGVPLSIWYDWKNDGDDPNENEHNFGTVLPDLKPKPAYRAIATLTRELSGFSVVRRMKLETDQDYVLDCENDKGERKLAAWTLAEPHEVTLAVSGVNGVSASSCTGEALSVNPEFGRLRLILNAGPQYVSLANGRVKVP